MRARETNHFPGTMSLYRVDRIGKVTFLGVLQQHAKKDLLSTRLESDRTLSTLQCLVLFRRLKLRKRSSTRLALT